MVNKFQIEQDLWRYFEDGETEESLTSEQYTIKDNGVVNVDAYVARRRSVASGILPVKFGYVQGGCSFSEMNLRTLRGSPHSVNGDFDCSHNNLVNLMYAPKHLADSLRCSNNQLTSLTGCPQVPGELDCSSNKLTDLSTSPPVRVCWATLNPFQHFRNTPGHIHEVDITYAPDLPMLGLLSVHKVEVYDPETGGLMEQLSEILTAHCGKGVWHKKNALACAIDLTKAGFKSNARL